VRYVRMCLRFSWSSQQRYNNISWLVPVKSGTNQRLPVFY